MQKRIRVNQQIRVREIRLIGPEGEQMGVVKTEEGLRLAGEHRLDLVEIAPTVAPPVCRIMDFSKYKYDQEKKEREARKKHHTVHMKEVKLRPNIEEHDYQVKLRALQKFLKRGDRTKVTLTFRGREMAHVDHGRQVLARLVQDLRDVSEVGKVPGLEGRNMIMILVPR